MRETEWVELVAEDVQRDFAALVDQSLRIETQLKLPYGYEIRAYSKTREPEAEAIEFATDFIVVEDTDGGWKPRVVVEAKMGTVNTHDAITYSQKAANHKAVFPTCATASCSATGSTTPCRGGSTGTAPNSTS